MGREPFCRTPNIVLDGMRGFRKLWGRKSWQCDGVGSKSVHQRMKVHIVLSGCHDFLEMTRSTVSLLLAWSDHRSSMPVNFRTFCVPNNLLLENAEQCLACASQIISLGCAAQLLHPRKRQWVVIGSCCVRLVMTIDIMTTSGTEYSALSVSRLGLSYGYRCTCMLYREPASCRSCRVTA
jgi:hypothetical protein